MMIWRLLASVLVVSDQGQRQRQTIKHEQAMSDSKNKTDTLRFAGVPTGSRTETTCLSGFRLLGLSRSAVRRSGCYFGPHTFSGSLVSLAALAMLLNGPALAQ